MTGTTAGAAPPGEEHDQRDERQHEDDGVNDHTAGDGDDEQDDGKSQKHVHPFPFWIVRLEIATPWPGSPTTCTERWFTAHA